MKNILNEYINCTKKDIKNYLKLVFNRKYNEKVSNEFLKTYINARYYNIADKTNTARAFYQRILFELKIKKEALILTYTNDAKIKKYIEQISKFFEYVLFFDNVRKIDNFKSIKTMKQLINELASALDSEYIEIPSETLEKLHSLVKNDMLKKDIYLDKIENGDFYLELKNDENIENVFHVDIKYNFPAPMQFSERAIDKIYNYGIISEEKLKIEYILGSLMATRDIIDGIFKDKYIVDIQEALFSKAQKLKNMLEVLNNEAMQEKISIRISYTNYMRYKNIVKEYISEGYTFAIVIDNQVKTMEQIEELKIFKFIIINKKHELYRKIKKEKVYENTMLVI